MSYDSSWLPHIFDTSSFCESVNGRHVEVGGSKVGSNCPGKIGTGMPDFWNGGSGSGGVEFGHETVTVVTCTPNSALMVG